MRKLLILLPSFLLLFGVTHAQDFSGLDKLSLTNLTDYTNSEGKVLDAAKYLLGNPLDSKNTTRTQVATFLNKWTTDSNPLKAALTPDANINEIIKGNAGLQDVYKAGIIKYILENKDKIADLKAIKLNSVTTLLNYCRNSQNKVALTSGLKKLIKAQKNGLLQQYLKM